jgi:NAD(P)-dependent dehydrogenase (short-subunit alcohol dehydrogenase family)
MWLKSKNILITGAARRIGRSLALAAARSGANIFLHHSNSPEEAQQTAAEIQSLGVNAWILQADFAQPDQAQTLIERAAQIAPVHALVNNAAIFSLLEMANTTPIDWQNHLNINLTAPFLLAQAFSSLLPSGETGRIVNILDWRALHPGSDHFPYTISKAALVALTRSLALSLAPRITVNGLALGAVLPPSDGNLSDTILKSVPAKRWADLQEIADALLFLLNEATYTTGEIIHLDGGRHLV